MWTYVSPPGSPGGSAHPPAAAVPAERGPQVAESLRRAAEPPGTGPRFSHFRQTVEASHGGSRFANRKLKVPVQHLPSCMRMHSV